ncbi:MAG: alkaline phosphatase [Clostridiales bacterium]|nr:alkaline phosphatase [Clostridiales bacterium]
MKANNTWKRLTALIAAAALMAMPLTGCGSTGTGDADSDSGESATQSASEPESTEESTNEETTGQETDGDSEGDTAELAETTTVTPKYVFLFIGDGMTYSQFQLASSYLGALEDDSSDDILDGNVALNFMSFDYAGSATTYDSSSFCPDSASTATSIASGFKTYSGVINMDETKTVSYTTIAEQLRDETDYKIGVISSVNLNHATPAAFYAHQASRNSYYEIGLELIDSGYDYFAGGGLLQTTGADGEQTDLYELAAEAGYNVVRTQAEAEEVTAEDGKTIIVTENLADSDSLSYEIDREDDEWSLADYVSKGIEVLENDSGFFLMCEGGKIDWACHANDAGTVVQDVLALADAVQVAIDFAEEHPDETLIIVTGDHETGGLSIGFAGTDYDTYLDNIQDQEISFAKYDSDYVEGYIENGTDFTTAMADVEELFGLILPENATEDDNDTLVLTDYEVEQLKEAYELTMDGYATDTEGNTVQTEGEYISYGTYTPFSVTVTHLLNNKSGINFSSYAHTGLPAAVFAQGVGAETFAGSYDNTDIHDKLISILGLTDLT